jgi:hypothetical protein
MRRDIISCFIALRSLYYLSTVKPRPITTAQKFWDKVKIISTSFDMIAQPVRNNQIKVVIEHINHRPFLPGYSSEMDRYLGSGNRSLKRSRDQAFSSSKAVFSDTSPFKSSVGPGSFRKALLATLPNEPRQEIEPCKKSKKEDKRTTLLHSAVLFGACPRTISGLIKRHPEAASVIDKNGRTPLHLACICWKHHFAVMGDTTSFSCEQERVMKVIRDLCDAASYSINIEDNDDMSALEYAIISDMPLEAVKRIQKASVEEWQMREHHPELFPKSLSQMTD